MHLLLHKYEANLYCKQNIVWLVDTKDFDSCPTDKHYSYSLITPHEPNGGISFEMASLEIMSAYITISSRFFDELPAMN